MYILIPHIILEVLLSITMITWSIAYGLAL